MSQIPLNTDYLARLLDSQLGSRPSNNYTDNVKDLTTNDYYLLNDDDD